MASRLAVALAALALSVSPLAGQAATWADHAGQLRLESHIVRAGRTAVKADEGWLAVPERRADPGSRLIEVHFVRLHTAAAAPGTPVVYLTGGPGSTATGDYDSPTSLGFWEPVLRRADVILLDQRGTRDPALRWVWDGAFPADFFVTAQAARAHVAELSRRAVSAMRSRGVDLAGYTTPESADDIDDLRRALALPRIDILGFSYGTHLALSLLRRHGAVVARAVLVGIEGPDHTLKLPLGMDQQLARLAAAAKPDAPALMALLDRADARLAREPLVVHVRHPITGTPLDVPVGPFGLHLLMRADVGDATDLPVFPRLLATVADGDGSVLAWFVQKRIGLALAVSGMSMEMDAASDGSPARHAAIRAEADKSRFADVVNFPFPEVDPIWNPPDLGADYHGPVVTAVPTLFLSGTWDWNTPPAQAAEVGRTFSNATYVVVANAGHEQTWWQFQAGRELVGEFLAGRDVRGRTLTYPPLQFIPLRGDPRGASHPSVGPEAATSELRWDLEVSWPQGPAPVVLTLVPEGDGWGARWRGPRGSLTARAVRVFGDSVRLELPAQDERGRRVVLHFAGRIMGDVLEGLLRPARGQPIPVRGRRATP